MLAISLPSGWVASVHPRYCRTTRHRDCHVPHCASRVVLVHSLAQERNKKRGSSPPPALSPQRSAAYTLRSSNLVAYPPFKPTIPPACHTVGPEPKVTRRCFWPLRRHEVNFRGGQRKPCDLKSYGMLSTCCSRLRSLRRSEGSRD